MTGLGGVFHAMEAAGVMLDVEAARDAVWLALRLAEAQARAAPASGPIDIRADGSPIGGDDRQPPTAPPKPAPLPRETPRARTGTERAANRGLSAGMVDRVRLPLAAGLQGERGVPGALRPLRRKVRAAAGGIDEEATVQRAIEDDLWLPVHRHVAERWLELTLVVDTALSMAVWQDVARELRRTIPRAGAFRDVRVWRLQTEGDDVGVLPASSRTAGGQRPSAHRRPFGGGRRGLVLVMTDCVSAGWYDGRVLSVLRRWSKDALVALLQVLPERMWARTALSEAIAVKVHATAKTVPNHHLHWSADMPVPEAGWKSHDTRVGAGLSLFPVVTTEPRSLGRLARMVAGTSSEALVGALFNTTAVPEPVEEAPPIGSALERVRRFWSISSSAGAELASLLAAAPVQSTAMLRLLRRELMPSSTASAEAEVLLSGLVAVSAKADARDGDVPLELALDVRQILLENAPVDRVLRVLREVAARMSIPGIATQTFESWLVNPSSGHEQLMPSDAMGAQVAAVLEQIGGPYALMVHPQARRAPVTPPQPQVVEPVVPVSDPSENAAPDQKFRIVRVFVSSPSDVEDERVAVLEVIKQLNATLGRKLKMTMEAATRSARIPFVSVERSHVYLGVMSARYGAVVRGSSRSGTAEDFSHALERFRQYGRPRILFYFDDAASRRVGPSHEDTRQYRRALRFREEVAKENVVRTYSGLDDFKVNVAVDLTNLAEELARQPLPGRPPQVMERLARPERFVGRSAELDYLNAWFRGDPPPRPALALAGSAGIGKSTLAAAWLAQITAQPQRGGVFADSVSGPLEDLLRRAIRYFSDVDAPGASNLRELTSLLVASLRGPVPNLIVLDDLDRVRDEDYGAWVEVLDEVIRRTGVKLLLLMPVPRPIKTVVGLPLGGLDVTAAVELLRDEGVSQDPDTLAAMAKWTGGSPLLLQALARALREKTVDWSSLSRHPPPSSSRELDGLLLAPTGLLPDLLANLSALTLRLEHGERDVPVDEALATAKQETASLDSSGLAQVRFEVGRMLSRAQRWSEAIERLNEALQFFQMVGDQEARAQTTYELGLAYADSGANESAVRVLSDARDTFAKLDDRFSEALALKDLGRVETRKRDFARARRDLAKAYERLASTTAQGPWMAMTLSALGDLESETGRFGQAVEHYDEALELLRDSPQQALIAGILRSSASAHVQLGDLQNARLFCEQAVSLFQKVGTPADLAGTLHQLGQLRVQMGERAKATEAFDRALELYSRLGDTKSATRVRRDRAALTTPPPVTKRARKKANDREEVRPVARKKAKEKTKKQSKKKAKRQKK